MMLFFQAHDSTMPFDVAAGRSSLDSPNNSINKNIISYLLNGHFPALSLFRSHIVPRQIAILIRLCATYESIFILPQGHQKQ